MDLFSKENIDFIYTFKDKIKEATSTAELNDLRVKCLGKSGVITALNKGMKDVANDKKREVGELVSKVRTEFETLFDETFKTVQAREKSQKLENERIDITMDSWSLGRGSINPVNQVYYEIVDILTPLGFSLATGPEIDNTFNNFTALNIPDDHPARDDHDTFFIDNDTLLRSHTSTVQIRTMLKQKPPVYIFAPGKVYRNDSDATHSPMFHQVECLVVDKGITFANLKWTLDYLITSLFGADSKLRYRSSFFPFTEPSTEIDMSCPLCKGAGCRVCKQTGWIEILGAGMVDPNVFEAVGIDHNIYSGFAFGVGIDRIAMIKYSINDLRLFFENNIKFLSQF